MRFVAGRAPRGLLLARALWRSVCREAALWRSFCWPGRREVRKGRRGAALGTLRVGDPALGTVGRCRSAKAARREPCAWEPVLGNLRGGPCAGKQGRAGRKWSLPQPVARILLCGALPEFKVKNLLLQCTYNGAGRDFLPHFNRNPA